MVLDNAASATPFSFNARRIVSSIASASARSLAAWRSSAAARRLRWSGVNTRRNLAGALVAVNLTMALGGCASEPASSAEPVECVGYMVTSQCPGAPMSMGMPVIGCHDDAGVFHGGCTYNAGPAGHETTSLCALVCPGF